MNFNLNLDFLRRGPVTVTLGGFAKFRKAIPAIMGLANMEAPLTYQKWSKSHESKMGWIQRNGFIFFALDKMDGCYETNWLHIYIRPHHFKDQTWTSAWVDRQNLPVHHNDSLVENEGAVAIYVDSEWKTHRSDIRELVVLTLNQIIAEHNNAVNAGVQGVPLSDTWTEAHKKLMGGKQQ